MNLYLLAALAAFFLFQLRTREQRQRIALLAEQLRRYQIEPLMERLTEGYQRALAESDPERRQSLWQQHGASELALADQVGRLANDFARLDAVPTSVSRIPLPYATRWWPQTSFDFRQLLALHARGLAAAASQEPPRSPQDRAYTLLAEMLLLQHSCHWFCRSRPVASARLLARHKTRHDQVLQSVGAATREGYGQIVGA
jgi:hypothetical protein